MYIKHRRIIKYLLDADSLRMIRKKSKLTGGLVDYTWKCTF